MEGEWSVHSFAIDQFRHYKRMGKNPVLLKDGKVFIGKEDDIDE